MPTINIVEWRTASLALATAIANAVTQGASDADIATSRGVLASLGAAGAAYDDRLSLPGWGAWLSSYLTAFVAADRHARSLSAGTAITPDSTQATHDALAARIAALGNPSTPAFIGFALAWATKPVAVAPPIPVHPPGWVDPPPGTRSPIAGAFWDGRSRWETNTVVPGRGSYGALYEGVPALAASATADPASSFEASALATALDAANAQLGFLGWAVSHPT